MVSITIHERSIRWMKEVMVIYGNISLLTEE